MTSPPPARRDPRRHLLALSVSVSGWTVSLGCSTHLHRPADLTLARTAQTSFAAAGLDSAIVEERARVGSVLDQELDLIRRHALARRDARLILLIGQGEAQATWDFLDAEIQDRLRQFDLDMARFQEVVVQLAQLEPRRSDLESVSLDWAVERASDPDLPPLTCTVAAGIPDRPDVGANVIAGRTFDAYRAACEAYLAVAEPRIPGDDELQQVRAARAAVRREVARAKRAFKEAQGALADAVRAGNESELDRLARALEGRLDSLRALPARLDEDPEVLGLPPALSRLGLPLGSLVDDLKGEVLGARLESEREQVLSLLAAVVDAPTLVPADATAPSSAPEMASLLATVGKGLTRNFDAPSTSALQIEAEQLRLDMEAAKDRASFFDRALQLLEERQDARRQELMELARVEQLRRQVVSPDCGLGPDASGPLATLFGTVDSMDERCRERVFKLLVAYSNSWAFGRVPQEEIEGKLIGLHHDAALDASEIAFARWNNLLGVPIDQLVALHSTGVDRTEVVGILSNVLSLLGVGAIAVLAK